MRSSLVLLAVTFLILPVGCDRGEIVPGDRRGIDSSAAEQLVLQHYLLHAAPALADSLELAVTEILTPSENLRQVRHRVLSLRDSAGVQSVDSGGVAAATLTRSDRGWAISGYDDAMAEKVANLTWGRVLTDQAGILAALGALSDLGYAVEGRYGVAADAVEDASEDFRGEFAAGITEGTDFYDQVVWVREASDTMHVCAERLPQGAGAAPPEFDWLDGFSPTCTRGPRRVIPLYSVADSTRAHILRSGGVLLQPLYR